MLYLDNRLEPDSCGGSTWMLCRRLRKLSRWKKTRCEGKSQLAEPCRDTSDQP